LVSRDRDTPAAEIRRQARRELADLQAEKRRREILEEAQRREQEQG